MAERTDRKDATPCQIHPGELLDRLTMENSADDFDHDRAMRYLEDKDGALDRDMEEFFEYVVEKTSNKR